MLLTFSFSLYLFKVLHCWDSIESGASLTHKIFMYRTIKACLSPAHNGNLAKQCLKCCDVIEIPDRIMFDFHVRAAMCTSSPCYIRVGRNTAEMWILLSVLPISLWKYHANIPDWKCVLGLKLCTWFCMCVCKWNLFLSIAALFTTCQSLLGFRVQRLAPDKGAQCWVQLPWGSRLSQTCSMWMHDQMSNVCVVYKLCF